MYHDIYMPILSVLPLHLSHSERGPPRQDSRCASCPHLNDATITASLYNNTPKQLTLRILSSSQTGHSTYISVFSSCFPFSLHSISLLTHKANKWVLSHLITVSISTLSTNQSTCSLELFPPLLIINKPPLESSSSSQVVKGVG